MPHGAEQRTAASQGPTPEDSNSAISRPASCGSRWSRIHVPAECRCSLRAPRRRTPRATIARAAAAALLLVNVGAASAPQKTPRQTASAHESFDELYRRGQRANAAIKTLAARFTETTTSSLLTRPLVAHGTLVVDRPSRVVMRDTAPEARTILIDGSRMITSWPGRNIRHVTDIGAAQGRVQKYFVNGSAAQLRGQFDIQEHDSSNRLGTFHVTMVPKRKQIREALASLDLWVDRSSLLLSGMRTTFANGDTKLMAFDDVVPNAPVERGAFTLDP